MSPKIFRNILLLTLLSFAYSAPQQDIVPELKGFYNYSQEFTMYSGYLDIQESPKISSHYVFITSKNQPQTDDVVVWLNGGPGCSSLLGFLTQLGPHMLFQGSEELFPHKNPDSWNNNANMLFLQSPPGVGFSLNQDKSYIWNDTRTASDNLLTIRQWFKKFPQFESNNFWVSGQSYCGMYIPMLADQLLQNKNSILSSGNPINFKGIIIGNGVMLTQLHWRRQARNTFYSRHSFVGPQIQALISHCDYNASDSNNLLCTMGNKLVDQATRRINPYQSIGICYVNRANEQPGKRYWYTPFDSEMYNQEQDQPCSSDHTGAILYFNDPTVQQQLHVPSMKWEPCSQYIGSHFHKNVTTIPLFENFKQNGLKILLFSGNVDAQVSYVETEQYIKQIGWKQTQPKRRVTNPKGSLQGWITEYQGLTFYVINAAGHMVPHDKPAAASRMFDWFRKQ